MSLNLQEGAVAASPYLEGGALCALGLIHANKADQEVLTYLENALDNTQHAVSACFASAPALPPRRHLSMMRT